MIRSFEYIFDSSIDIVFEHLVHKAPNYDEELMKSIKSYKPILENGKYVGFEIEFDIGGEIAHSEYRMSYYEKDAEVRYLDQGIKLGGGKLVSDLEGFPFHKNNLRFVFSEFEGGTKVLSQYHIVPKGLFSWLTCFFYVFPKTKKQMLSSYKLLNEILSK